MPLLILLFIVLPIAELYVIIQVGEAIGVLPTLILLLLDGFLGAALARSQGRAAWRRFNEAMAAGRVPATEVFDGAAIIFGGAMLLAPGFITDVFALALLLPPTRALIRGVVLRGTRKVGAARPLFYVYERRAGKAARESDPSPVPGAGRSRGFDVDGSAREIPIDPKEIDDGRQGG